MTEDRLPALLRAILIRPDLHIGSRSPMLLLAFLHGWAVGRGEREQDVADLRFLQESIQVELGDKSSKSWARILDERYGDQALTELSRLLDRLGW